jgi:hypothetical protein
MRKILEHRALPGIVLVCLFLGQAILRFRSDLVSDAAWYLYVADGLLHGKHMYADYIEVNPPLAFWLMVPVAWLGGTTALGFVNALYCSLLALTALAVALVNRYLRMLPAIAQQARHWLCVLLAGALLFLPAGDFGEREHFMVLLFMPWLFLRLAHAEGAKPSHAEAIAVGVMAAIAICFKPQSVMAPVAVELFLLWRYRRWQSLLATENLAALAFVAFYATLLYVAEPEFMGLIVNLGVKAYLPFYGYPAGLIWFGSLLTAVLIALALLLWWQMQGALADVAALAILAATGFLLSYFIQYKGFSYQVIPALVFATVACATGVVALASKANLTPLQKTLLGASLLLAIVHFSTQTQGCVCDERVSGPTIAKYAPNAKSVFIASVRVGSAFPLVLEQNLVWASRLPTSWLTPYVASKWQDGPLPDDAIIANALDWAVTDLATFQPGIVFIDESTEQLQVKGGLFDYVKFWSNDARFAALWAKYERRATINGFAVYTLR